VNMFTVAVEERRKGYE